MISQKAPTGMKDEVERIYSLNGRPLCKICAPGFELTALAINRKEAAAVGSTLINWIGAELITGPIPMTQTEVENVIMCLAAFAEQDLMASNPITDLEA